MTTIPEALNLALQHHQAGRLQEAEALYRQILEVQPVNHVALHYLGLLAHHVGKSQIAVDYMSRAIAIYPDEAIYHNNLGAVLQARGQLNDAASSYQRALTLNPNYGDPSNNLAVIAAVFRGQGHVQNALTILFKALEAQPASVALRRALAESLRGVSLASVGESARAVIVSLCRDDRVSAQDFGAAMIGLLKNMPAFSTLIRVAQAGDDPFVIASVEAQAFMNEPLLLAALSRMVVADAEMEQVLTHLRRRIMLRIDIQKGLAVADDTIPRGFVSALARQCFIAEYAFYATEEEERRVEVLRRGIESALQRPSTVFPALEGSLVLLALYGYLHRLKSWERLLKPACASWGEAFQPIVREQLMNRKRELDIAARLTAVTDIKNVVSRTVSKQYEENPYPRWVSVLHPQPMPLEVLARRLRPDAAEHVFSRPVSVLVAGCGAGHHPIQIALGLSECKVLAVDLSRASLAYATRMAEELGITNITFRLGDILELSRLKRRFALIESAGVLHHLKDPMAGWRILAGLLEPHGLMKIGLYSAKARQGIQAARRFARTQGFSATAEGIRNCRRAISDLPDGHPVRGAMTFTDYFSMSGCRDLIMHSQEHLFTLPDIADCLDRLGLRFLGLECDVQVQERFRAMFPDSNARSSLTFWHRFEEAHPETFKSMYQFWCCKKPG
ncbi:MAG: methyltransferase domain-containing protein [Nitrospirae bacterium]|nr:MAG: methyltransferase domain-containing protein [Nitrospirota bacterium]